MASNNELYPAIANLDDRISEEPLSGFVVDYTDAHGKRGLRYAEKRMSINGVTIRQKGGEVFLDDQPVTYERHINAAGGCLVIMRRADLVITMTNRPQRPFTIGPQDAAIVVPESLPAVLTPTAEGYQVVVDSPHVVYHNGQPQTTPAVTLTLGDTLRLGHLTLSLQPTQLKLITHVPPQFDVAVVQAEHLRPIVPAEFPDYRRSPRILMPLPDDKLELRQPESAPNGGRSDLVRTILPPLGMVAASFATTMLAHGNPVMTIGMGGASLLTAGLSVSAHFTNKKQLRIDTASRKHRYQAYLLSQAATLEQLAAKQRASLDYHYPDLDTLTQMMSSYSSRIYEKTFVNHDFLDVRLGSGDIFPSFKANYQGDRSTQDPLSEDAQHLVAQYSKLDKAPVKVTLNHQVLGLAGAHRLVTNAAQSVLLQLAAFQSYRDVNFVALVPEADYDQTWRDWQWLPHFQLRELNLRGLIHDNKSRDMVLNSFYRLLGKRRQAVREAGREKLQFSPHYVLLIQEDTWLSGHGLNEYLAEDMDAYGVSVVWTKEAPAMLPESVTTMARFTSNADAVLINEDQHLVNQRFEPLALPTPATISLAIHRLANLHHVEVEKNAIPETVTFMDMYHADDVNDLDIANRWRQADTSKSLAVPLGLRGKDDLVNLNLHERAHGPHGLVAGTTGSGKSETIQSYMLSLAVNFAPEDVGFLPIDFKGGGMANLFQDLPHLLGSITNLDGASSARALASIRAELQKRQRLFGQFGVNHINGYTKLYKQGKAITDPQEKAHYPTKPMPHLFLISDEFAELKANEPDFMDELVSTARIGRSLGVHLILATQKPSGVVNDQIWSNSRFKLALKVQDVADSNEILKTPDAASIVEPGRAYLQVGNNEIYELFQSAWSGAKYLPGVEQKETVDERIFLINDLGQYELISPDLSADEEVQAQKADAPTQLEAVVEAVHEVAAETHAALPDKPWLPPLGTQLVAPTLDVKANWATPRQLAVAVGMLDIPTEQAQRPLTFDFTTMKHAVIFSSPGFGKSTFLQTLVMQLAEANSPEQVQFHLLDFGTNALLPLNQLPHTADIVQLDQDEKLGKMLQRLEGFIDDRRRLFQKAGVSSLAQYEQAQAPLPVQVVILDGYDAVIDHKRREDIDHVLTTVLRDGAAVGVYMVITTNRSNALRTAMMANVETKAVLFMVDETEPMNILGRDRLIQQDIPGRGQLKYDDQILAFQTYLPAAGEDSLDQLNALREQITALDEAWDGKRPEAIPMVPDEFGLEEFMAREDVQAAIADQQLPIGINMADTSLSAVELTTIPYLTLSYTDDDQAALQRAVILAGLQQQEQIRTVLVDMDEFITDRDGFDLVLGDDDESEQEFFDLIDDVGQGLSQPETTVIVVTDLTGFIRDAGISNLAMGKLLNNLKKTNVHLIVQSPDRIIGASFDSTIKAFRDNMTVAIVSARLVDTGLIQATGRSVDPLLPNNEAYLVTSQGRRFDQIKLPGSLRGA
ncbi:MAG: type VII secretion protein EssC [Lactobacillus sp.]|jgi:S-DNA-T family DNA segregation ATPase FtsK/SpoIIIE|nr:type VII secretion protein EssC [Lactobacillus sp.]MCI2033091.1 type VII secretion protein EssC [Lactobacillus sp.]